MRPGVRVAAHREAGGHWEVGVALDSHWGMDAVMLGHSDQGVHSSVAEQWIADPRVTGSNPVVPLILLRIQVDSLIV